MSRRADAPRIRPARQEGVFLLEAMIAILIFSIGILGLVGLQMSAIKQSSDASYRSEAAQYADELVGSMWVSDRVPANMKSFFEPGGAGYVAWSARLNGENGQSGLPGVKTGVNQPSVTVDSATGMVTIEVFWQAPGSDRHSHKLIAQIR